MTNLLVGVLGAMLATNQPAAVSNLVLQTTGISVTVPDPNDPVEKEYEKLLQDDQAALDEVDGWIRDNNAFAEKGGGVPKAQLNARIMKRFEPVKKAYQDFIARHPDHARAHLAYGSFLEDIGDEDAGIAEYEKARTIDPKNPAAWNQLANHFVHDGPIKKAFEYYAKAIELDPTEPVYYRNLGNCVYMFRKDAEEYYKLDEQQVFDKALGIYQQGMKMDPKNFEFAQDFAESFYGIRPTRTEDALKAWTNALQIADNDYEREGVHIHLARFKLNADRFAEARQELNFVTNSLYDQLKGKLIRNLDDREKKFATTNGAPAKAPAN